MRNITYGFGGTQTHNYDQQYRLTAQTLPGVHEMTYPDYDANSNLRQRTDPILSNITNYDYDPLDRLDFANGLFGDLDYDYDPNDNRTLLTSSTGSESYNYITNSNQLSLINGDLVPRDAAGNIMRLNERDFTYDGYNRLITVVAPGGTSGNTNNYDYSYNGLGQRVRKRLNISFPEPDLSGDIVSPGFNFSTTAGLPSQIEETTLDPYSTFTIEDGVTYSLEGDFSSFGFLRVESTDGESNFAAVLSRNIGRNVSTVSTTIFGTIINGKGSATGVLAHADRSYHANIILTTGSLRMTITDSTGAIIDTGDITVNGLNTNDSYHLLRQSGLSNISLTRSQLSEPTTNTNASSLGAALYTYDLQGRVIHERFEAGTDDKEYIYINNQPLAVIEDGIVYYIYNDHLNTPQRLSDLQGNIVWQASYTPFGAATINDDVDGDGQGVSFNLRFPGQYFDVESNLHYNYYRYYSPQIGRYITSDPIGLAGGVNTFGYVKGNPVRFIDSFGLELVVAPELRPFVNSLENRSAIAAAQFQQLRDDSATHVIQEGIVEPGGVDGTVGGRFVPGSNGNSRIIIDQISIAGTDFFTENGGQARFSVERVIAHELQHAIGNVNNGTFLEFVRNLFSHTSAIDGENLIINQFDPCSSNRNRNDDRVIDFSASTPPR